MKIKNNEKLIIAVLLFIFSLICISSYIGKSPTFDEVQHLSSGYASLKTGSMSIGLGHPPLFRLFTALPLLMLDINYPYSHKLNNSDTGPDPRRWTMTADYDFAHVLFYESGNNAETMFFLGRLMAVIAAVFIGLLVYSFSKSLYGIPAGMFSLFLYVFSPAVIANARLTVNDMAGAGAILLVIFVFSRYALAKNRKNFILLVLCTSVSVLVKFNCLLLLPFILAGLLILDGTRGILKFFLLIAGFLVIVNLTYGFGGTFDIKVINYDVFSKLVPFKLFDGLFYQVYRYAPLPEYFLKSVVRLLEHSTLRGHSAFFMGEYSTAGWWYYFPMAFLFKTPVLTTGLVVLWIVTLFRSKKTVIPEKILIMFAILYSIFAVRSKINIGYRHILPLYPILFVLLGRVYGVLKKILLKKSLKYGLLVLYIMTTQAYYPHYLPFFNCFIRPENGYKYLADSNLDFGQDLPALKKYIDQEGSPDLILSYFGTASVSHYGIKHQALLSVGAGERSGYVNPVDTRKEYLAVSATNLNGIYYQQKKNVLMACRQTTS
ncbi:MAG: glycosyltransferase family 39 protein [Elusimicrobiota bacterium]